MLFITSENKRSIQLRLYAKILIQIIYDAKLLSVLNKVVTLSKILDFASNIKKHNFMGKKIKLNTNHTIFSCMNQFP